MRNTIACGSERYGFHGHTQVWFTSTAKGDIRPAMSERMIAILVEELERAGVSARVEVPSDDELDDDAPAIHDA